MKKISSLKRIIASVAIVCFAEVSFASTGFTYNDFTYNIIDPTNKIVEVTSYLGSNVTVELLTEVVSPVDGETYAVEKIADDAFNGSHIADITLPLSIKTIGVSAFANCQNLVVISLPTSVETISNYAFFNCSNLKDVSFGDVKEIGVSAIRGGSIVGEHSVIYAGEDEVFEIKHEAHSKNIFVNGAIKAAEFLVGKPAGLYIMHDVLFSK